MPKTNSPLLHPAPETYSQYEGGIRGHSHTPTPWIADDSDEANIMIRRASWCLDQGGDICAIYHFGELGKANAAHIVRCVNAHDDLVAALKDCIRELGILYQHNACTSPAADQAIAILAKVQS